MLDISGFTNNFILCADGYELDRYQQVPESVAYATAHIIARKPWKGIDRITVMGNQVVAKILASVRITDELIAAAKVEAEEQGYEFNQAGWESVRDLGYLPIESFGIEDGTIVPVGVPVTRFRNTVPGFAWLVSYIQSWAQGIVAYMTTIATQCRVYHALLVDWCKASGTDVSWAAYMLHNFGERAVAGRDQCIFGAMAHGVYFRGTDCSQANRGIKHFYNTTKPNFSSVTATEHSTSCMSSDCDQRDDSGAFAMALNRLVAAVSKANRGIGVPVVSAVVDTFNDKNYIENFVAANYDRICEIGGKFVSRLDSGDPLTKPALAFGWLTKAVKDYITTNADGWIYLPANLGMLQGDGLNFDTLPVLIQNLRDAKSAAANWVLGMGGGLMTDAKRDHFSFTQKGDGIELWDGTTVDLFKDPIDDLGKRSHAGATTTYLDSSGQYFADRVDSAPMLCANDAMVSTSRNGKQLNISVWDTVQQRAA